MKKAEMQRLSAEHLFQHPSCGPSPGPVKLHLVREVNCPPGGMPTCQLTVGHVPLGRRADIFGAGLWSVSLTQWLSKTGNEEMRKQKEKKNAAGTAGPRHQLGNLGHA